MIVAQFSKTKSFLITTLICVCLYYFCCLAFRAPVVENEDKFRVEGGSKFMMRGLLSAPLMSFLHQSKDEDGIQGFTTGALLTDSDNATDDSSDCSDVHQANKSQRCHFVQNTDDCQIDEGFINYNTFVYCDFDSSLVPLALIILFVWWLFLFIGLAVTADDYFCPALAVISKTLRLSHNIAGVTFLAFGNGAPDIFSAIAAIGNAKNGEAGLAFGALFGAGVFVTAVVAGTIAIIHPFDAMQRPFLRDVIFYLAAVFWTFVVMWDKEISEIEAIGFILMYIGYVLVVVVGRWYYQRTKKAMLIAEINVTNDDDDEIKDKISSAGEREPLLGNGINKPNDSSESEEGESSVWREFLSAITPIDTENWSDMGVIKKTYEVFKSPLVFLLIITTPVVDYDEDKHKWNRYLNSLQCTTGLVFSSLATQLGTKTLGGAFPVWVLVLIIGICLSLLVFCTSQNDTPPKYHHVFAFLGFLVAVIWIYSVANEVVNILQTFGVVFSISNAILGLTLLAWGNSIGDLIADTVMARQGYPRMGISACFGGPLFNLLLGIGIPFTIGTIKQGQSYKLSITFEEYVLAGFLALSLLTSLVIVPLSKFKMSRPYGITLIILYVVFLIVALLTETSVIDVKV